MQQQTSLRATRAWRGAAPHAATRRAAARPSAAQRRRQQQPAPEAPAPQQRQQERSPLASAAAAAALSLGLMLSAPALPPAHAAPQTLADLVRADYGFIDSDGDGIISRDDLRVFNEGLSAEEGVPAIADGQLDFSLKLFDLEDDGKLTADELLRSLALDGAVDDSAVDAGVFKVFDRNSNGKIDAGEFSAGLGPLGPDGEGAKRYIFNRVNRLTDSNGQLDTTDFGTALVLARTIILGY